MKNYCIVQANSCKELESLVNKKMKDGWELHGTIVIDSWEGGTIYHQVLTVSSSESKMLTD